MAVDENLETVLIESGKPWQNGTNESFNGKFRDECLFMEWFRNWPYSSLNYLTPR